MKTYTIAEVEAALEAFVERANAGEDILIERDGVPVVKLVAYEEDGPEAAELA